MSARKDDTVTEAIEKRAAEWFVQHRDGNLSTADRQQYLQWLRASPRHVEAYLNVIGVAAKLPEAMSSMAFDLESDIREVKSSQFAADRALFAASHTRHTRAGRHRWIAATVMATAGVLVALGLAIYWVRPGWLTSRMIVVPTEQQRVITLEDGSVARVDSDTRLRIAFSRTRRLIELPEGHALFSVTHDVRRPFIVHTGNDDIVAVGTQFDVYRRNRRTLVTVVEGRVEIVGARPGKGSPDGAGAQVSPPLQMSAGQQIQLTDTVVFPAPRSIDTQSAIAWTRRVMTFSGTRLEDVAAQFNRHTGAHIQIDAPGLKDYKVNGVFQAYDVDSFVEYLRQFSGVTVMRNGDDVRVEKQR